MRREFLQVLSFEYFTGKPQNIENRGVINPPSTRSLGLPRQGFREARRTPTAYIGPVRLSKNGLLRYYQIANSMPYMLSLLRGAVNEKVIAWRLESHFGN
jgi:hypothetical protein